MRRSPGKAVAGAVAAIALLIVPATTIAQRHGHRGDDRGGYDPRDRDRDGYRAGHDDDAPRGGRRQRCRDAGTGGTIIGAIAGGLLGNSIAGSGDRTAGTILGAGGGAIAGRALDRDC